MGLKDLKAYRLSNQLISANKAKTPLEAVLHMGALQAQDYGQAVWAVGLRTQGATLASIEQAIASASIIRTWPMRGTIHFVPPEDASWMLQLSAARMVAADRRRQEQLGIDIPMIERCREVFIRALQGGKRLTRPEILRLMESTGVAPKGSRGYHILWYIAQTGTICIGPMEGKQQTFMLLEECAPNQRKLEREEAIAELTRRYFTGHGPATLKDFSGWSGLTLTECKAGLAAVASDLAQEQIDGTTYWLPRTQPGKVAGTYLLPGFDEYFLGYRDRSAIIDPPHANKVVPGNNGMFKAIVVKDGRVVGTWRRSFTTRATKITVTPFEAFTARDLAGIQDAAEQYAHFAGLPLAVLQNS